MDNRHECRADQNLPGLGVSILAVIKKKSARLRTSQTNTTVLYSCFTDEGTPLIVLVDFNLKPIPEQTYVV